MYAYFRDAENTGTSSTAIRAASAKALIEELQAEADDEPMPPLAEDSDNDEEEACDSSFNSEGGTNMEADASSGSAASEFEAEEGMAAPAAARRSQKEDMATTELAPNLFKGKYVRVTEVDGKKVHPSETEQAECKHCALQNFLAVAEHISFL
eukprot:jgi/Tetstr1/440061/TSEL_028420.t1